MKSKVAVVEPGNVGATCANVLAINEVASEVVLLDVKEGVAGRKSHGYYANSPTNGFLIRW